MLVRGFPQRYDFLLTNLGHHPATLVRPSHGNSRGHPSSQAELPWRVRPEYQGRPSIDGRLSYPARHTASLAGFLRVLSLGCSGRTESGVLRTKFTYPYIEWARLEPKIYQSLEWTRDGKAPPQDVSGISHRVCG